MRILLLDTYYPRFLSALYEREQDLATKPFDMQRQVLLDQVFGTSDFYSRHLRAMGHDAQDLIVNCKPLQRAWAREHGARYSEMALRLPSRLLRLPGVGPWLSALPGLVEIAVAQIKAARPDVLYCQDLWFLTPQKLAELRPYVRLIVGQIASPLPPGPYLKGFDLITTSFPHFVPRLRAMGIASEYFRIGFDTRVLDKLGQVTPDVDASFVGGISRHHGKALPMLEALAQSTPIQFFGYGAGSLGRQSPIAARHRGEVWGLDMYRALARSRVTLNRHINVAENYANNMRLYEATGVGSLLITDRKDNLGELFEIGKEVVAYDSPEEAAELIRHYIAHPDEAQAIAKAGQARTLREHTYQQRMTELAPMLERHLAGRPS
ncbi:CgeB family protein [Hydrogenophaga sp. BPS33]|uniref:CgeB family protein n=1 Tax=Hydrogenophaga sp. BPS33 TaxID=2651974 RepID=UPI00131FFAFB|nr:glycosyltransferase [Hydrogenophaga sp. BPS33]QHE83757.1 glycosyltransferase [Hydrogenophaga sp. BPS33]